MDGLWPWFRDAATLVILSFTVWATIAGPDRVYRKQRQATAELEKRRRQHDILHALMKTRMATLHQDHVMALNLVQLEFYGHDKVQDAFRRYREHLDIIMPQDQPAQQRWLDDRQDRFYTLVKEMADVLDYKFDKNDLRKLSYSPQGWANDEAQIRSLRALMIQMFEGKKPIPVTQWHASVLNSKFPEPPTPAQAAVVLPPGKESSSSD